MAKRREGWSDVEVAEAKDAAQKREGMTRPLRLSDLSSRERDEALGLVAQKNLGIRDRIQSRVDSKVRSGEDPSPADVSALASPDLKPRNLSVRQMSNNLVSRTERAATGPERLPEESLSGVGFYFGHRRKLSAAEPPDVHTLALASSRLSPKTPPSSEARTAVALSKAHSQQGTVLFHPELVDQLGKSYKDSQNKTKPGVDVSHLTGQAIPFAELDPKVVTHMRKAHNEDVVSKHSYGVDWQGLRSTGLDANVQRAHRVLQGDQTATPDIYQNPKQTGYAESISQATPGNVEREYMFRAAHLGRTIRGEISHGQTALDITGLQRSNEGMLSNEASIAGDTWTRRATSGHPLSVAGPAADTFITSKGDVGAGDTKVQPVGIEHAIQQAAVEGASKSLENKWLTADKNANANITATTRAAYNLPEPATTPRRRGKPEFTVPSRLVQETGGWAQPRRESGEDPEFNARNVNQHQHTEVPGQQGLF